MKSGSLDLTEELCLILQFELLDTGHCIFYTIPISGSFQTFWGCYVPDMYHLELTSVGLLWETFWDFLALWDKRWQHFSMRVVKVTPFLRWGASERGEKRGKRWDGGVNRFLGGKLCFLHFISWERWLQHGLGDVFVLTALFSCSEEEIREAVLHALSRSANAFR